MKYNGDKETASLILMNKNTEVCRFLYDFVTHSVMKIEEVFDDRCAPLGIIDFQSRSITRKLRNEWWRGRCIPDGRSNITNVLRYLELDSQMDLLELSHGLSLSDQYWVNMPDEPARWEDINFFGNDFSEKLGDILIGGIRNVDDSLYNSPDNSTDGMLEKKWKIDDGRRCLIKGGRNPSKSEPFNELAASMLYKRILDPEDYVAYSLENIDGRFYSVCECIINEDEEMIPALYIDRLKKFRGCDSNYEHYISVCDDLGIEDARTSVDKMIVCDYIMHNHDRHYRNFGIIRNVETLEYTRIIPLFDNGNSLWHDSNDSLIGSFLDHDCHPFRKHYDEQLKLVKNLDWYDPEHLEGFTDELKDILSMNPNMSPGRIEKIARAVQSNIDRVNSYRDEMVCELVLEIDGIER